MQEELKEIWKDIKDYEGLYQVSNFGRVKSLARRVRSGNANRTLKETILKPNKKETGYLEVGLYKNQKFKSYLVHRLVAIAFISNPNNYPEVNHKHEFEKQDNNIDNLEWATRKENANYGTRNERHRKALCVPVYQYTLDKKLVRVWDSMADCNKEKGFSTGNISQCCKGIRKKHKNFIWSYELLKEEN